MSTPLPEPADRSGEASRPAGATRFRILTRGSWRRAFKLEDVFWDALELGAREAGQKLTDYVRALLDGASDDANQTAFLRAHAAALLAARLDAAREQLAGLAAGELLKLVPAPGFVIARGRGLVAFNPEFVAFMRRAASFQDGAPLPNARMNLEAPLATIVEALRSTRPRPLECGFALTIGDRVLRGRVRVSLPASDGGRDEVMGFVLGSGLSPV